MTSEHNSSISGMAHLTFLSPSHLSPKDDAAAAAETCSNQWIYDISTRVVYPLQVECFGFSLLKRTNSNVIHIVDGRMKKRFGLQQGCRKIRIFIRTPPHSSPAISMAIQRRNVEEKMNIKSATATWWCSTISTFFFSPSCVLMKLKTDFLHVSSCSSMRQQVLSLSASLMRSTVFDNVDLMMMSLPERETDRSYEDTLKKVMMGNCCRSCSCSFYGWSRG